MTNERAQKLFFLSFFPSMGIFMAITLVIAFATEPLRFPPTLITILAIAAGLALVNSIWAHWRYVNRIDEFLRSIQIKAILSGLGVILTIASVWGYFEQHLDAPTLQVFYLNPIYWCAYGVAAIIMTKQTGGEI